MPSRPASPIPLLAALLVAPAAHAAPGPWQRTEVRAPCAVSSRLRNPYFGDLHVHTRFSADAYIFGTRVGPREAYEFAQGGMIAVSDEHEAQTRSARLDRPIDFTAVTDHAEFFGEVSLCDTPGSLVYDENLCQLLRAAEPDQRTQGLTTIQWLFPDGATTTPPPPSLAFCNLPGVDCDGEAVTVWHTIQAAAEEFYDRDATCGFTTFIGYENTASPLGRHQHRNVIFRNEHVPAFAKSFLETYAGGTPQGVWDAVETDCLHAGTGCDAIIIPHNSNLSEGLQWLDPADATEAQRRQTLEPLAEIHQAKGNSECRFDRLAGLGAGTNDELCTFEVEPHAHQGPGNDPPPPIDRYPQRNMIRNTLKDGLALEERLGVNPFRLGFTGSTDTHNGTAGNVAEAGWVGIQGQNDATPAIQISDGMRTNPGGLTVAWAEENSRDAIFDALRRRETYATSGTRPIVRFFGGDLARVGCRSATLVHDAYAGGTPMGGELGAVRGRLSPRFVVWAMKDPGTVAAPGTDLQRIQIVKGWVDKKGATQEQVFDVAGSAGSDAGVDPATCAPTGNGAAELCTVWRDPHFDRRQRAFYYARVLENPSCRWSTLVCKAAGVDPLAPGCPARAAAVGPAFANCCLDPTNDPFMDPLIQERAWTSPIWYRPESVARLKGRLRFGSPAGRAGGAGRGGDTVSLRVWLGRAPEVATTDLTVRLSDDADIYAVTIPARALRRRGRGLFALARTARPAGLRAASLAVRRDGQALLRLETLPLDLARVDRAEHMVTVALESGTYRASYTRLWVPQRDTLVPGGR